MSAPLVEMVRALRSDGIRVHAMRDITRGGLAPVLHEFAVSSGRTMIIQESLVPVKPAVRDFCGILGLEPVYMGNEGKMAVVTAPEDAERAKAAIEAAGETAYILGRIEEGEKGVELI